MHRRDAGVVAERSRLVTGSSPRPAGNSTLSRLVSLSSRPCERPTCPWRPSASSAASSSSVGAVATRGRSLASPAVAVPDAPRARGFTSSLVRPADHRLRVVLRVPARHGDVVVLVQQQPLLLAAAPPRPVRTSTKRPCSFSPSRSKCSSPSRDARRPGRRSRAGAQVPRSHTITSPPPYSPARDRRPRSRSTRAGGPRRAPRGGAPSGRASVPSGTAQLTSTPSISRRRS